LRVAVVLDKSGTIVKAHRVLCGIQTGVCFACDSTLRFVAENCETLVNVRGSIGDILKGDLSRLSMKVSCSPNGGAGEMKKDLLDQPRVLECLKQAISQVRKDWGNELGICAALLVDQVGQVTHAVALGGAIYGDVRVAVATLKSGGDDVFLATGNCKESSMRCARLLGIPKDFVLYDADPGEKRDLVRKLRSYYGAVVMVGNDINDIDAMGEAEVGVMIRRADSPCVNGLERRVEVDFVLDSLDGVAEIVRKVKEPLSRSTDPGTRGACAGGP
jgi:soluble P-type ATPase